MPQTPLVRTVMDSQNVKAYETLLKSARQSFSPVFWKLSNKICSKNYVLVVSEILWLFLNILTPDDKYSLSVKAGV